MNFIVGFIWNQYLLNVSNDPIFFKLNVKHILFRCSFSCGHINGSFSMAKSYRNVSKIIELITVDMDMEVLNGLPVFEDRVHNLENSVSLNLKLSMLLYPHSINYLDINYYFYVVVAPRALCLYYYVNY